MSLSPMMIEVERIYFQLIRHGYRTLTITSSNRGEGVTALASALAQRSLLAGKPTLVVDLNLLHPNLVSQDLLNSHDSPLPLPTPELVGIGDSQPLFTGIVAPSRRDTIVELRKPGALEKYIEQWQQDYELILFDTAPVSQLDSSGIPAERIAAASDGTLLMVMAGHTTQSQVSQTIKKLNDAGAHVLGCVLNDKHNPTLKVELLRTADRFAKRFPRLANKLKQAIEKVRLFSLEL